MDERYDERYDEVYGQIIDILTELHDDVDYDNEDKLVDDSILDSFDLITLVASLNSEFDIVISGEDFVEENFNSAAALTKMTLRLTGE